MLMPKFVQHFDWATPASELNCAHVISSVLGNLVDSLRSSEACQTGTGKDHSQDKQQ